jgi:hypothetical protein
MIGIGCGLTTVRILNNFSSWNSDNFLPFEVECWAENMVLVYNHTNQTYSTPEGANLISLHVSQKDCRSVCKDS